MANNYNIHVGWREDLLSHLSIIEHEAQLISWNCMKFIRQKWALVFSLPKLFLSHDSFIASAIIGMYVTDARMHVSVFVENLWGHCDAYLNRIV